MAQNIVYITIDSIRADRVGFLEGTDTTPVLDKLADSGTVFEQAVANGIPTYYSFKSLLGGIHSLSHDQSIGLPPTATSLAEVFSKAGYETVGFNARNPWLTAEYGYDRGFDKYESFIDASDSTIEIGKIAQQMKQFAKRTVSFSDILTDKLGKLGRSVNALGGIQPLEPAEAVTDAAINWIRSNAEEPFFLWIHYMDPHYPWVPPNKYLDSNVRGEISRLQMGSIWHTVSHEYKKESATVSEDTLKKIHHLYDAEVRRTDAAIGRLLDALKKEKIRENCLVVATGDHGTELGDHGGFSHGPRTLYNEIIRVPLIFEGPKIPSERRDVAALVDIPQTIASTADGVRQIPDTFEGIDLFRESRNAVTTEVVYDFDPVHQTNSDNDLLQARTEPPWKLVQNLEENTTEIYNILDDPQEHSPVDDDETEKRLIRALTKHRKWNNRRNRTIAEKERIRRKVSELYDERS